MKKWIGIFCLLIGIQQGLQSQSGGSLETIAVMRMDTKDFDLDPSLMSDYARIEIEKLGLFQLFSKHDLTEVAKQRNLEINNCYGQLCALDIGTALKVDKVLDGSLKRFGEMYILNLRLIDVGSRFIEKNQTIEYIDNLEQLQLMVRLTIRKMFALNFDVEQFKKMTKRFDHANVINTPKAKRISASGLRMGMLFYTGKTAKELSAPVAEGGMGVFPIFYQIGCQAELNYLNSAELQGIIEILPMVTGLNEGLFIPSITFLNGFRNSRTGFEIAFGPSLALVKMERGYVDDDGFWRSLDHWRAISGNASNPFPKESRMHRSGWLTKQYGFVFGIGKTFKVGNMNLPINIYYLRGKDVDARFGISIGYNSSEKRENRLSRSRKRKLEKANLLF